MDDIAELLRDGNASELASQLRLTRQRLEAAERRCDPCGLSLAECMDARRAGKLACCPECSHPALAGKKNYMDKYPGGYKEWEDLHGRQEP